jgi:hypothetical protein
MQIIRRPAPTPARSSLTARREAAGRRACCGCGCVRCCVGGGGCCCTWQGRIKQVSRHCSTHRNCSTRQTGTRARRTAQVGERRSQLTCSTWEPAAGGSELLTVPQGQPGTNHAPAHLHCAEMCGRTARARLSPAAWMVAPVCCGGRSRVRAAGRQQACLTKRQHQMCIPGHALQPS